MNMQNSSEVSDDNCTEVQNGNEQVEVDVPEALKRSSNLLTVVVSGARNLLTSAAEGSQLFVKVELGSLLSEESNRVPKPETNVDLEFDFSAVLSFEPGSLSSLDSIISSPLTVTVMETLPREKRQKEAKTITLCFCQVDLEPFIKGALHMDLSEQRLIYVASMSRTVTPGSPSLKDKHSLPAQHTQQNLAQLIGSVSVEESLLSPNELKDVNVLSIMVQSCHALPVNWGPDNHAYNISLPVPFNGEEEKVILFPYGSFHSCKEPKDTQLYWAGPYPPKPFPEMRFEEIPIENCNGGDLKDSQGIHHRKMAETSKPHVSWNMVRRCLLDKVTTECFQQNISKSRHWPILITRVHAPPGMTTQMPKTTKPQGQDAESCHGMMYANFTPLLYPGVTCLQGGFRILAYNEVEMFEHTKRAHPQIDGKSLTKLGGFAGSIAESKKLPSMKRGGSRMTTCIDETTVPGLQLIRDYDEPRTYALMRFTLEKPLVPKKELKTLARKVLDYIHPKKRLPPLEVGADKAVEEYHTEIIKVAQSLISELSKQETVQCNAETAEQQKQKLMQALKVSGKYFAYKEQLKNSVIKIVREKYLRTTSFTDDGELQHFLSKLYTFLIDEMHVGMHKAITPGGDTSLSIEIPESLVSTDALTFFAKEAELMGDHLNAEKYYTELIGRDDKRLESWYNYGKFCLMRDDMIKAESCFKECLVIDKRHLQSMTMFGIVCALQEKYDTAETFLEIVTSINPTDICAWTIFGLYYEGFGNDIGAEGAFDEALKLQAAHFVPVADPDTSQQEDFRVKTGYQSPEKSSILTTQVDSCGFFPPIDKFQTDIPKATVNGESVIFMETTKFLLENRALLFAERALGHLTILLSKEPVNMEEYSFLLAKLHNLRGSYEESLNCINEALEHDVGNALYWGILGTAKEQLKQKTSALECYERALALEERPLLEMRPIYMQLGNLYLDGEKYEEAKQAFLQACVVTPSCLSWLGAGKACYRLDQFSDAEQALTEANLMDNLKPEVWAYLSLVSLKLGHKLEAEQSYKYTLKCSLDDETLLQQIHDEQEKVGFGNPQF